MGRPRVVRRRGTSPLPPPSTTDSGVRTESRSRTVVLHFIRCMDLRPRTRKERLRRPVSGRRPTLYALEPLPEVEETRRLRLDPSCVPRRSKESRGRTEVPRGFTPKQTTLIHHPSVPSPTRGLRVQGGLWFVRTEFPALRRSERVRVVTYSHNHTRVDSD